MLNKLLQALPFEFSQHQEIILDEEQRQQLWQRREWLSHLTILTQLSIYMTLSLFGLALIYILIFSSAYVTLDFLGLNFSPLLFILFTLFLFLADTDFLDELPEPKWQSHYQAEYHIVRACLFVIFPFICILSFFINIVLLSKLWNILF